MRGGCSRRTSPRPSWRRPGASPPAGKTVISAASTWLERSIMNILPADVVHSKSTPLFDQESVPAGLRREHSTAAGVWGRIVVHEGSLRYVIEAPDSEEHLLVPGTPGIVEPG